MLHQIKNKKNQNIEQAHNITNMNITKNKQLQ